MSVVRKGRKEPLVVLDTNILISYLWGSVHCLRIVRAMLLENRFTPAVTPEIIGEFDDVVSRPRIKRQIGEITPAIFKREYLLFARMVHPRERVKICDDSDDNILLECAQAADAEYIVTGDDDLLRLKKFGTVKIVTPADFIREFLEG